MSNEFYNYIASNILDFFQNRKDILQHGERYCLKLDTEDMVCGVNQELMRLTSDDKIQGEYNYKNEYHTYTIRLYNSVDFKEVVVAAKLDGMTDDFLATLRNAELTKKYVAILMLTSSTIDTIASGTGDLSASGMPFHSATIIKNIQENINASELSVAERTLLEVELKRKQSDRYSDNSSLYEYAELLTVLKRAYVTRDDFGSFSLLYDDKIQAMQDPVKIEERIKENHRFFDEINHVFKYGNIEDDLGTKFDSGVITSLKKSKKANQPWYKVLTYDKVKSSYEQMKKKKDNPLDINDDNFIFYSVSKDDYLFPNGEKAFIRDDGDGNTAQQRRKKNILIYNPDKRDKVTIQINANIVVKSDWIEKKYGCNDIIVSGKTIFINVSALGCIFASVEINDPRNNITFTIRICVVNVAPKYLENMQTCYQLHVTKQTANSVIMIFGVKNELIINPRCDSEIYVDLVEDHTYECSFNRTLHLKLHAENINSDTGRLKFELKCGTIMIPVQIQDEKIKSKELTGIGAFKLKFSGARSLEYRKGTIVYGTKQYFTKDPFRTILELESQLIDSGCEALEEKYPGSYTPLKLTIPSPVHNAYLKLINLYRSKRTLPSLCYYGENDDLYQAAANYVESVETELASVEHGATLSANNKNNDLLMLGCVVKRCDEDSIEMSPLQPLNVKYQLQLLKEHGVGEVRNNLLEKLTPLYLIPYIKDQNRGLYQTVEQKGALEWRYYTPVSNRRFFGTRTFVSKLVRDKIIQYHDYFAFLFDDLGNNQFYINLINMGDCREVFEGILRFYAKCIHDDGNTEKLLSFVINIYCEQGCYNEFSLLADQKRLEKKIKDLSLSEDKGGDVSELEVIVAENVKCYYRSPLDPVYQYAHLTFYEMASSENTDISLMNSITTGTSLGGLTSEIPSVLNAGWYKTGFGTKYANNTSLTRLAAKYNSLYSVAYSGSSYDENSCIFTEIEQDRNGQLGKIYQSSNWVIFVNPKVDLSFFQQQSTDDDSLMIIHYSDQYTSASGYDDITVTRKTKQYEDIIAEHLHNKGIETTHSSIKQIINLFNAINGGWMLRLISQKKLTGAADNIFSREKMSILSAIKLCMAYYKHPNIVWVPISLEEMLRVSGGAGLSQKDGLLSAKNLGFEQGATCDDILLVGIEGPKNHIKVYLHPIEVKIGQVSGTVLSKAFTQLGATYKGLWQSLWPEKDRNSMEQKLTRNFFMQLVLTSCEKMKLYNVYPDVCWDDVLDEYREDILNENYEFSKAMDSFIGKGTIVSFASDVHNKQGTFDHDVCLLEFPEHQGSSYMVLSTKEIEKDLDSDREKLPEFLKETYVPRESKNVTNDRSNQSSTGDTQSTDKKTLNMQKNDVVSQSSDKVVLQKTEERDESDSSKKNQEIYEYPSQNTKIQPVGRVAEEPALTGSESRVGMRILFGTDQSTGKPLYWFPNDTSRLLHTNTGIIGTMGTGKTQFTKSLITQLYRDRSHNIGTEPIGILIFDYKGDYNQSKEDFVKATDAKVLQPYHLPFNPLAILRPKVPKHLLPIHTANSFKDTLSKVYDLGAKQQDTLFTCINDAYSAKGINSEQESTWNNIPPTFDTVYQIYTNNEDIKKNDSLAAAMNKLNRFKIFESDPEKTKSLFDLLKGVVVIDLSGYDEDIQSLTVAITLDLFYSNMQATGSSLLEQQQYRQLTKMILVDEADNFMSKGFPALKKILKEGREFGVGTILSTQFLRHFGNGDDDYSAYILTWVVHNVADLKNSDVDFVFKTESKGEESKLFNDIKKLEKHHSIVKVGIDEPAYIKDKAFWELWKEIQ